MLLKSLEIHGFKSFPDKTKLDFGQGITAVVGPNGSGKSNISDAVRWVLGEQSTKSLRGSKMQDVVFGGTSERRPLGFAQVTLTIDNSDRSLNAECDEVAVTRRYYRSGESEYMLNGAAVRLKDINELFMDTGLGRDGYSIIGQGKIADIVSSKSEDRREIFEEAAGISKYRYRKEEAERSLLKAQDNLDRLSDILSELESRVEPLREQSRKAQEFLTYAEEKKGLEIGLWLYNMELSKERLREHEHSLAIAAAHRAQAEEQLEYVERRLEETLQRTRDINAEIDALRRDLSGLEEESARNEGEIAVENNTLFHNAAMIEKLNDDIRRIEGSGIEEEISALIADIEKKRGQAAEVQAEYDELVRQADSVSERSGETDGRIEELRAESARLSQRQASERVRAASAKTAMDALRAQSARLEGQINDKREQNRALTEELARLVSDIDDNTQRLDGLRNRIKGYELRLEGRRQKTLTLTQALEGLRRDEKERLSRAEILTELERSMEGFSQSVKRIMKQAGAGALSGIHGPVSRLIKTEPRYSAAIETALGAAMQNIVVGTEQDAKSAIRYLKQTNGGRATFLPMTAIRGKTLSEGDLGRFDGFIGTADTLVRFDEKYRQIISSLLGRVAVAEDLDCAVAIAKNCSYRFKVVTLDGQVVNAGGSMSGGSLAKSAGLLSRGAEIERLRREAAEISEKAAAQEAALKAAKAEQAATEAETEGARAEAATAQEDRVRLTVEHRRVSGQRDEAAAELERLLSELHGGEERMTALKNELEDGDRGQRETEERLSEINAETEALGGDRQELIRRQRELSETLSELSLRRLAIEKDIDAARASCDELRRRGADQLALKETTAAQIAEIERNSEAARQRIEKLKARSLELNEKAAGGREKIAELGAARDESDGNARSLRLLEREKTDERERIGGELARLEERKAAMLKEYDDISKKLYDEYRLTRREAEKQGAAIDEPAKAQSRLNELKAKIRALGSVNVAAIEEYKEVSQRYEFLSSELEDVEKSRDRLYRLINDLTGSMEELFTERFSEINKNFEEIFVELFGGGKASLSLTDPDDVLRSGIDMLVQPPGKNVQNIDLFSGGEKSLTAIALYFAIMRVSPAPFCILDEIEAALDDVNVDRFAAFLRRMCVNTQFIAITHRRGTMEEADTLYGVTMQEEGVSKLLELKASQVSQMLGLK